MPRLQLILATAVTATLLGCGADEPREKAAPATPTATTVTGAELEVDFKRDADAWAQLPGGTLALGDPAQVAAPQPVGPPSNVLAQVVLPPTGRAGVFCGRYGVAVGVDGRYGVYRLLEGEPPEEVLKGQVEKGGIQKPGEPWLVRLLCGERDGDEPVSVGFMINASPVAFAQDKDPVGEEDAARVGVLGIGAGEDARFLLFSATAKTK